MSFEICSTVGVAEKLRKQELIPAAISYLKHYLQLTDADFEHATGYSGKGGAESGARSAQNEAQRAHAEFRGNSHETKKAPDISRAYAIFPDVFGDSEHAFSGEDRIRTCGRQ
jgi:hypothetical protein